MDPVFSLFGLKTSSIVGALTLTKTGTTARTATFPDAAITVAGKEVDNAFSVGQTITGSVTGSYFISSTGLTAVVTNSNSCLMYRTNGSGSGDFASFGHLIIQPRTSTANPRDIIFYTGDTTPVDRMRISATGVITCTGAVTVPNGTAAAPGIRATTWASGLWASTASRLNVSISGVTAASIFYDATNGGEIMLVGGTSLQSGIFSSITTGFVYVSGSTGPLAGGQIRVYGSAHATKTNYVEFTRVAAVSAYFDGSGIFTLNNTTDASAIGTAAIVGLGGASIAKSLWVGGTAGNYINIANSTGELRINGTKVVSAQGAAVTDAAAVAGTATLAGYGFVSAAEFNAYVTATNAIKDQLNALLARCRAHGLIA